MRYIAHWRHYRGPAVGFRMLPAELVPGWPAERKADMADHKTTQPIITMLDRRDVLGLAGAVATFGIAMTIDISGAGAASILGAAAGGPSISGAGAGMVMAAADLSHATTFSAGGSARSNNTAGGAVTLVGGGNGDTLQGGGSGDARSNNTIGGTSSGAGDRIGVFTGSAGGAPMVAPGGGTLGGAPKVAPGGGNSQMQPQPKMQPQFRR
jgi:hypothetical protein